MRLLTIPKASKESGIPYDTLLRLVKEGHVQSVPIPGRRSVLVDLADIQAFIEGQKSGSIPGSKVEERPLEMATNKGSRRTAKSRQDVGKYVWMADFTRKRKSC